MDIVDRLEGIERLGRFMRLLQADQVDSREAYKRWRGNEENLRRMSDVFGYKPEGEMPNIGALIGVDFHPTDPLVKLNYTSTAHNTLHAYPYGWTPAVRMCRGSIFDRSGDLIAHAFPKFFNRGEHPETMRPPVGQAWTATDKRDGHLGINFNYARDWHITTRGDFGSPSSRLGDTILRRQHLRTRWRKTIDPDVTVLTEIIDPATKVHVDYGSTSGLVLIGAYHRRTFIDYSHSDLASLGQLLGIPVTEAYEGTDLDTLVALMDDLTIRDREGFVVRFAQGLRMKIKFATYINLMVEAKLSPKYLMQRVLARNLDRMIKNLDSEIIAKAHEMLGRILRVQFMPNMTPADLKARRNYLYSLVPPEESTQYYRGICREFLTFVDERASLTSA